MIKKQSSQEWGMLTASGMNKLTKADYNGFLCVCCSSLPLLHLYTFSASERKAVMTIFAHFVDQYDLLRNKVVIALTVQCPTAFIRPFDKRLKLAPGRKRGASAPQRQLNFLWHPSHPLILC